MRLLANFYQQQEDRHKIVISARRNTVHNGEILKFTRLKRTPFNMDNGHSFVACPEAQTRIHCLPLLFTDTGYLRAVYFPCNNHVLIVDIAHCSNNDRFLLV